MKTNQEIIINAVRHELAAIKTNMLEYNQKIYPHQHRLAKICGPLFLKEEAKAGNTCRVSGG